MMRAGDVPMGSEVGWWLSHFFGRLFFGFVFLLSGTRLRMAQGWLVDRAAARHPAGLWPGAGPGRAGPYVLGEVSALIRYVFLLLFLFGVCGRNFQG